MADAQTPPQQPDLNAPILSRNALMTLGGIVAAMWLTAAMTGSKIALGIVGVLTLAVAGGLFYLFRQASKQRKMLNILQAAQASPQARKEALEQLQADDAGGKDVLNQIARAQLQAQEDPDKALLTLEAIDMTKVPAAAADDVRSFRGQLYLWKNRIREAREQADLVKLSNAGSPQSKAMMAALIGEAWARTGKHEAALELLSTFNVDDPEFSQARLPLLFARIFANFASGKKERARKDINALMKMDINYLGRFLQPGPGVHLELKMLVQDVAKAHPDVKRQQRQPPPGAMRSRR